MQTEFDISEIEDWTIDDIEEEIFETKQSLLNWAIDICPDFLEDRDYLADKLNKLWNVQDKLSNCGEIEEAKA